MAKIEDVSFDSNGDLCIYHNGHHPYILSWYKVKGSVIASDLGGSSSGGQDKGPEAIIVPPRKAQCAAILLPWCEKAER